MNTLLNEHIFDIITNMSSIVLGYASTFVSLSLGIASILIMFVIAQEGFNLMMGNKRFDPLWWIRPLLMLLIIITWQSGGNGSLPSIVSAPFRGLEQRAKSTYLVKMASLDARKKQKLDLLSKKWEELLEKGAEAEAARNALTGTEASEEDEGFFSSFDIMETMEKKFESLKESIINYTKLAVLQVSTWVDKLIEWIGNFIWAIAVYATFMAQSLSIAFLTIFGPMAFGISVYDIWKDAWATWLMRFISFQLYGWVAYIIMTASCSIIDFGIRSDIQILTQPGFPEAFSFNAIYTLSGYLVGAMALKMVPEVVSWVVPTNASQAAGQFSQGISSKFGAAPVQASGNVAGNVAGAAGSSIWSRTGGKLISQGLDRAIGKPYGSPGSSSGSSGQSSSGQPSKSN